MGKRAPRARRGRHCRKTVSEREVAEQTEGRQADKRLGKAGRDGQGTTGGSEQHREGSGTKRMQGGYSAGPEGRSTNREHTLCLLEWLGVVVVM